MAKHNDLGKAGENAAVAYLEQKGYLIRNRNWRKGHFELDIVAAKDNELIVIEVKTRSNTLFAEPEGKRISYVYSINYLSMLKSFIPKTSVDISPNQPLLLLTPTCTLIKSTYFRFASLPSKVTAWDILK